MIMIIMGVGKKIEFDHTNQWYMHDPESVLENKTQKFSGILRYKGII